MRLVLLLVLVVVALAGASVAHAAPGDGPGGPVLVVVNPGDPYGRYYAEILRAEGLNEFAVADAGSVTAQTLAFYRVVVLAPMPVSDGLAAALTGWVVGGGDLVAMRPDARLAGLLGLGADTGDRSEGTMQIDTSRPPGAGITGAAMQYHGTADLWTLAGATPVAALPGTQSPAVTLRRYGAGQAAAFAYDLARSVVETRQGNPAWAGQKRDGQIDPIRSDDLFFPDWVDFSKIAIPQADEQQRLLANLITRMAGERLPLPRFWYFPRGARAVVVMTGDDHAHGGTAGRFDQFDAASPRGCSLADWQCVRGTSYMYPDDQHLTDAQAAAYQARGFELALHLSTGCGNYQDGELDADWNEQLGFFRGAWPSLAAPRTNRTHCIAWSDWAGEPKAELAHGVRLDANYYYWPGAWLQDRPGMFTGSGMPMRFADLDGSLIDVYQATTQMTDESEIDVAKHIRALLDGALGAQGYFGAFTANMHTDDPISPGADAIVAEATLRGVPIVSASQLLEWLDGRNGSSFGGVGFAGNRLTFSIQPGAGARGLQAMLPVDGPTGRLQALSRGGVAVAVGARTVKGIDYAVFDAAGGAYTATYGSASPPPTSAPAPAAGRRPAARDHRAPHVVVRPRTVRASRRGAVRLRVKCPRSERRCWIRLRLQRGRSVLARRTVTVGGGKTAKVTLRLTRRALRRLVHRRSLRAIAVASARDRAGNRATTRTRVRLLAPRRR
jgi:hypothetical protein